MTIREMIRMHILGYLHRATLLESVLAECGVQFIGSTKEDIHEVLEDMVLKKQVILIEYTTKDIKRGVLLPFDCDVTIKIGTRVDSFTRIKYVDSKPD